MQHFLSHWGYLALIVLTVAEAACIPIPSEVTVGTAGLLAGTGRLNLALVIVLGTLGETAGSFIGYAIGRYGGRALVERFGRFVLLAPADLDRAERWFDTRGEWSVLLGRVLPVIRTFVALPAGLAEMQLWRFGLLTALGSLVWIGALAGTGYALGNQFHSITHGFSDAGYVLVALAVLAVGVVVVHRIRSRRDAATGSATELHGAP